MLIVSCIAVGLSCTLMIVKKRIAVTRCSRHSFGRIFAAVAAVGFEPCPILDAGAPAIALLAAVGHACVLPDGHRRGYRFDRRRCAPRFGGDRLSEACCWWQTIVHHCRDDGAVHSQLALLPIPGMYAYCKTMCVVSRLCSCALISTILHDNAGIW